MAIKREKGRTSRWTNTIDGRSKPRHPWVPNGGCHSINKVEEESFRLILKTFSCYANLAQGDYRGPKAAASNDRAEGSSYSHHRCVEVIIATGFSRGQSIFGTDTPGTAGFMGGADCMPRYDRAPRIT